MHHDVHDDALHTRRGRALLHGYDDGSGQLRRLRKPLPGRRQVHHGCLRADHHDVHVGRDDEGRSSATGTYLIEALGAAGGQGGTNAGNGGHGADAKGTFALMAGQMLTILVGAVGSGGYANSGAGGGGGSFVVTGTSSALVVAGGGGGGAGGGCGRREMVSMRRRRLTARRGSGGAPGGSGRQRRGIGSGWRRGWVADGRWKLQRIDGRRWRSLRHRGVQAEPAARRRRVASAVAVGASSVAGAPAAIPEAVVRTAAVEAAVVRSSRARQRAQRSR